MKRVFSRILRYHYVEWMKYGFNTFKANGECVWAVRYDEGVMNRSDKLPVNHTDKYSENADRMIEKMFPNFM